MSRQGEKQGPDYVDNEPDLNDQELKRKENILGGFEPMAEVI